MSAKLILITLISLCCFAAKGQNALVFNKLTAESRLNQQDSLFTVTYKFESVVPLLIWKGDFNIAAINTQNDVSGKYLGSPIVNEIYFFNKSIIQKQSNGYFLRIDTPELNLSNYAIIYNKRPVSISFKIKNDTLFKLLLQKKLEVRMVVTLIDYTGLEQHFSTGNHNKFSKKILSEFLTVNELQNTPYNINLDNLTWNFNRQLKNGSNLKETYIVTDLGDLSKSLIHNSAQEIKRLPNSDLELLYRFANKMYFTAPLKIIN